MKKISYALTILLFSVFTIQPANANLEVVMGPLGLEVVTNFAPPASFGPTVGGHNGASPNPIGGSFGVVDSNGNVTNIVVCYSYCANGTFGPGGDTAALQIPNSNVGVWFGPNTTTYDRETKTFTAINPIPEEITETNGSSSARIFGNRVLSFTSGNLFVDNTGKLNGYAESWVDNSTAIVSTTENSVTQSLNLQTRKNSQEIKDLIEDSNLLLLNNRVDVLISLLDSWVK
jgi:hypothetical protein